MLLVSAMAAVTTHLGFGVTCNLGYEPPYVLARRMSTLDHLTKGRMGWNIVTGYLDSAARGMGQKQQPSHDRRYDQADEFMQVVYKLWEGSWQDDAVVLDRERADIHRPGPRCRPVRYEGEFYRSMPSICASLRRSGRLSSTRPAPRAVAGNSRRPMPSVSSSTVRRRRSSRRT